MLPDQILDLIWRRNDHVNVFTEREPEILCRAVIERIRQRDTQCVTAHLNGKGAVQPRQATRDETQSFRRNCALG
jgi:hypothetical protein